MFVHEVMTAGPVTLRADDTVTYAAQLLVRRNISSAPVVDDAERVIGMISEADLLVAYTQTDAEVSLGLREGDPRPRCRS